MSKKILFIAGHEFLYDPKNGGQKCSLRNYQMLQQIYGVENVYLSMFSNYEYAELPPNTRIFPTQKNNKELFINTLFCRNVCDRKVFKTVADYVKSLNVNVCFVDSSTIGGLVQRLDLNIPVIVFFHNIEKNYAWNKFKHEGMKYIVAYFSYYWNEKKAVKIANKICLLNKRDEKELYRIYGRKADYFLPISFSDEFEECYIKQENEEKKVLLFVGSLFQPNYEGILWFVNEVMSKLDEEKYVLKIVGKNLEKKEEQLKRKNVEVIGTVDDLAEYYYNADAVIIPIFYGDGMKVKTAEAMMYGKMIFATDEALEGYDVEEVEGIYRCNNAKDFIDKLQKTGLKCYAPIVRRLFKSKYDTKSVKEEFRNFIDQLK